MPRSAPRGQRSVRPWRLENADVRIDVEIPPDAARLVVVVPAGGKVTRDGPRMLVDGVVADRHAAEAASAKP